MRIAAFELRSQACQELTFLVLVHVAEGHLWNGADSDDLKGARVSFDDLIRADEEGKGRRYTEGARSLEIDPQFKLVWLLHWQVARLLATQDAVDVRCRPPEDVKNVKSIRH